MSDRKTNVEMDDVLSSIRRLVEDRVPPRPAQPQTGRLVLTPALMVVPGSIGARREGRGDAPGPDPEREPEERGHEAARRNESPTLPAGRPASASSGAAAGDSPPRLRAVPLPPSPPLPMAEAGVPEAPPAPTEAAPLSDASPDASPDAASVGPADGEAPSQLPPRFRAMERAWQEELARRKTGGASGGPEPTAETAETGAAEDSPRQPPHQPRRPTLEERIAELEAAVSRAGEEWEPDGSEPEGPSPFRRRLFEVVSAATPVGGEALGGAPAAPSPAPAPPAAGSAQGQPSTPLSAPAEEAVQEGSGAPAPGREAEAAEAAAGAEAAGAGKAVFSHSDAPFVLSQGLRREAPGRAGTLPQEGNGGAEASAPAPAPAADGTGGREGAVPLRPVPAGETPGKSGELVEDDDLYLDLDLLREMIADVVHEELRGRLGETITRNLRRMIRAEIERALLRQDPQG